MAIEDLRREEHIEGSSDRVFGLVFAVFFLIVAGYPLISGGDITVFPIGVLMRMSGKDPLRLKYDSVVDSYWIARHPPGPDPRTFDKQF